MRFDCRQGELSGLGEEGVLPHGLYRPVAAYRAGTAMAVPHLWGTRTSDMQKWVWLLSLRSMAVPLPNCSLQSCSMVSWNPGKTTPTHKK